MAAKTWSVSASQIKPNAKTKYENAKTKIVVQVLKF